MPGGLTQNLPDLASLLQERDVLNDGLDAFTQALSGDGATRTVLDVFGQLDGYLDVDVAGITTTLPNALTTIQNSLPAGSLEFVESLQSSFTAAQDFLNTNSVIQHIGQD